MSRKLTPFRRAYLRYRISEKRRELKLQAIEYKGGKCIKCGYNKCPAALTFHHIDSSLKEFGIAQNGNIKSFERMKPELDKCLLLCHNCHAELHAEEDAKVREEKKKWLEDNKTVKHIPG
jgi:deoxycytidylate deaminase